MAPHKGQTQEKEILKEIRTLKQGGQKEGRRQSEKESPRIPKRVTSRKQKHPSVPKTAERLIRRMTKKSSLIRQFENLCCIISLLETVGRGSMAGEVVQAQISNFYEKVSSEGEY